MRLFLIRHGQTAWNVEGRAQGHVDIELDSQGIAQAEQLGLAFRGVSLARVVTSDLRRAAQTAEQIASAVGCPIEHTPALRERSFGDWEGLNYAQLRERMFDYAREHGIEEHDFTPPNGESAHDLFRRVARFGETLQTMEGDSAVVTHGGACAQLLASLLRGTVHTARSFRFDNTAVTELLRRADGHWTLLRYGDTSHLREPSAPMVDVVPTS